MKKQLYIPLILILVFVLTVCVGVVGFKDVDDVSREAYAAQKREEDAHADYVIDGAEGTGVDNDAPSEKGKDTKKKKIELDEPLTKDQVKKMDIKKERGDLSVPKVGLNARMRTMSVVDGVINPPSLYSAYRVRQYGQPNPDAKKMTVVAVHSIRGASNVPGTKLINVSSGKAKVGSGDDVYVKGQRYKIYNVTYPIKLKAKHNDRLWEDHRGKLLLITCLQRPSGKSVRNVFIEAYMVDNKTGKPLHDTDYTNIG